ncbi:helix-turn-helix domain-containing protein, partial [Streptomyces sp. NPDC052676]|uniref:helix-turn-helix domain-containing protein n=1 Tax=Streptomyces sp. NPDC052676 TaxID=3154953 RepID=UPI00342D56B7
MQSSRSFLRSGSPHLVRSPSKAQQAGPEVGTPHPGSRSRRRLVLSRRRWNWWAGASGVGGLKSRAAGCRPVDWPHGEADVGHIEQGLGQALRTRPVPLSTEARLRFLLATHRYSTQKVAAVLGVSQRTVQRWVTKKPG